jgi:hypothetical protein
VQPQLEPSAGGSSTLRFIRTKMRLGRSLKMSTPDFSFSVSRQRRHDGIGIVAGASAPCNGLVGRFNVQAQTVQPTNPVPMNSSIGNDS